MITGNREDPSSSSFPFLSEFIKYLNSDIIESTFWSPAWEKSHSTSNSNFNELRSFGGKFLKKWEKKKKKLRKSSSTKRQQKFDEKKETAKKTSIIQRKQKTEKIRQRNEMRKKTSWKNQKFNDSKKLKDRKMRRWRLIWFFSTSSQIDR